VVATPDQPRTRFPYRIEDRRLLWFVLASCWVAIGMVAWFRFFPHLPPAYPPVEPKPPGAYDTVHDVTGATSLHLERLGEVRLAGTATPQDATAAARAAARLKELAAPGATVYVEDEPQIPGTAEAALAASVYLPPAGGGETLPFPYGESRLLGAALIQEGLVKVDATHPYRYLEEFQNLEDDARRHRRGLWAAD
jgi:hypothetical protein